MKNIYYLIIFVLTVSCLSYSKATTNKISTDQSEVTFKIDTLSIADNNQAPNNFTLFQNYPNPFNPTTTIKYYIPKQTHVSLKIYNVLGSKVADLVNRVQQAGEYKVVFNAQNIISGVYYFQLKADEFSQVKKMILLK